MLKVKEKIENEKRDKRVTLGKLQSQIMDKNSQIEALQEYKNTFATLEKEF